MGRFMLILLRADNSEESVRREKEMLEWMGGEAIESYFCRVRLPFDAFGATAGSIGVTATPALILVRDAFPLPIEMRIIETLQDPSSREEVAAFIDRATLGRMRTQSDQVPYFVVPDANPADLFVEGEKRHREGDRAAALEILLAASRTVTESSLELRARIHAEFGSVAYEIGEFGKALAAYQEAIRYPRWSEDDRSALLYQIALLLNDAGMNEAAAKAIIESVSLESNPAQKEKKNEISNAIKGQLFVLAGMGYPGVVGYSSPRGGGETSKDRGDPALSHDDRLKTVGADLARIEDRLRAYLQKEGRFPDHLGQLPTEEPLLSFSDPFLEGSDYRYLRYEDPEEAILYSVGPDGVDQFGEEVYDPSSGAEGPGDIVRRLKPDD